MTPRKWFWIFFAAAALWFVLGTRVVRYQDPALTDPAPKPLQRIHIGLGGIVRWSLSPIGYVGGLVQTQIARLSPAPENQTISGSGDPQRTIAALENQIAVLQARYDKLFKEVSNYKDIVERNPILSDKILLTRVVQWSTTMNNDTLVISGGAQNGVRQNMPLICNSAVVGKIANVGPVNSDVRLVSDPRMKTTVTLRRNDGVKITDITTITVSGNGQGEIICRSVGKSVTNTEGTRLIIPPQPGDRLYINDPNWPAIVQGWPYGIVTEVIDDGALYYTIRARAADDMLHPGASGAAQPAGAFDGLFVIKLDK